MPSVTYDARSFMLDGRRIWLVGGSIAYARVPRELWADRIHAAKLAGLNTIEVPVLWNRQEPRPGQFDFAGENDLRHFVRLIGDAGMYCILRPGPYVGLDWDFGGLPAWLMSIKGMSPRTANGPFLEACSRYLTAVAEQVRDLQVTSPGKGGPIVLVQNESSWTCGHETLAAGYLGELGRYLREAGITVPTINTNNLWAGAEGEIDCWSGGEDLLGTMRELAAVRRTQPRMVFDHDMFRTPVWGREIPAGPEPAALLRRLSEIVAGGAQFVVGPFHAGTNFGFWGGRTMESSSAYSCATTDSGAPVSEVGAPGRTFGVVKRIATFASRFGRVLANLDPSYQPVGLSPRLPSAEPRGRGKGGGDGGAAVVHAVGPQGGVAFVFAPSPGKPIVCPLLLSDGRVLDVPVGEQGVAWCLLDVLLTGRSTLDYCSLSALGAVGKVFVCFGPPGAEGAVSVNGSRATLTVPKGKTPLVVEHEGLSIVVCDENHIDTVFVTEAGVHAGVSSIRADGTPVALPGSASCLRVDAAGSSSTVHLGSRSKSAATASAAAPPALGAWTSASAGDHAGGTSARFASIDGPAELGALGSAYGYGWYRVEFKAPGARKARVAIPDSGDRVHLFSSGKCVGVLGSGPGAARDLPISLRKGDQTIVALAENLGRASGGADLGERKGLYGHVWEVKPLALGKGAIKSEAPVEALAVREPLWDVAQGDLTSPDRLTWSIKHQRKSAIFLHISSCPARGLLMVNGEGARFLDRSTSGWVCLDPETLGRGAITVQIALLAEAAGHTREHVEIQDVANEFTQAIHAYEGVTNLTAKGEWSFARWEAPAASAYKPASRGASAAGPTWWRASFPAPTGAGPLLLELAGMTKGQIYLNSRHVGRYFIAEADGTPVVGQTRHFLPPPFLAPSGVNELTLFDEHGGQASKCRLVFAEGSPIRA